MLMLDSIKSSIMRIDAMDVTEFYTDGQQVINRVKELTQIALKEAKSFPVCPVRILLLDF